MRKVAVIMAGGSGTRLWPLSRAERPKQLLRIVEGRSLIHHAFERLRPAFPATDIYVIALERHGPAICAELPTLPKGNFIGEPMGRDTANAIGFAAAVVEHQSPDALMGVFTADHIIRPNDRFLETVERGYRAAADNPDALVTFGIRPTEPHTGFGYIERGDPRSPGVWQVKSFKEKPDLTTARGYVASGRYDWNSGMFVWRTPAILKQLETHLPDSHSVMQRIAASWGTPAGSALAAELYQKLSKVSIDFAVIEKAAHVLVVEMALDWLDVGNWTALPSVLGTDGAGNTKALSRLAALASRNNIFVSEGDHLIAAIGVDNLVVVHSQDATLICHRDQVQRIKELVAQLEHEYQGRYQ